MILSSTLSHKSLFIITEFCSILIENQFPGGYSEWEPPDSIPNSEVKTLSADDSVGFPHVKVGHRQGY
jgi:hypothetical protein